MESNNLILKKVITETEGIFARIAENYPLLLKELERGTDRAIESLNSFSAASTSGIDGQSMQLDEFLELCKSESRRKLLELEEYKKKNDKILSELTAEIDNYRNSQAYIEEIRDISESLQIVSLNALCNAVKAGKGGEGFSVITENLKDVTVNTIEKTVKLEDRGNAVQASLEEFYKIGKEINSKRKALLSKLEQKVLAGIEAFQSESETADRLLREIGGESETIRKSILRIMEELQQQDIIRQTIDQILLSLSEIPADCENYSTEAEWSEKQLDNAVFCIRLTELSVVMLEEIIEKIKNTIEIFTDNFSIARRKLEFIQNEKNKAVKSFVDNLASFGRLSEISSGINNEVHKLSVEGQGRINIISVIIGHVEEIAEEFESFDKISGWLQNVAILSRIELSRSLSLVGMRESVDDMSGLVDRIQQQISHGEKETGSFIARTSDIYEKYRIHAGEEMNFLIGFTQAFLRSVEEISELNNIFSVELTNFDFFTDEFTKLFELSEKELDRLKEISDDLSKVCVELKGKDAKIRPMLTEKLHGGKISDWYISDDNMNKIIERFTIYSHKKAAEGFGGVNVEDSVLDAGEVTLF